MIAVADIQRAIFDYGNSAGYVWNLKHAGIGTRIHSTSGQGKSYTIFDNIEARGFNLETSGMAAETLP